MELQKISPTSEAISAADSKRLFKWNLSLGVFHLVTSAVLFAITDDESTAPVYYFFPDADTRGISNKWIPQPTLVFHSRVGYLSAAFLLLAAIDHLLVATIFRKSYEWYLAHKRNPFRWVEYSISASIMHVLIAELSGIFDLHLLVCIFGLTMTTMLFGNEQEFATAGLWGRVREKTLRPFWIGFIPHVFQWTVIIWFFFNGVSRGDPPDFVWAIIFILVILDTTFAINMWLQQKEIGKWRDYVYGEVVFCILSLSAKQLLAWINYGGTRSLNADA